MKELTKGGKVRMNKREKICNFLCCGATTLSLTTLDIMTTVFVSPSLLLTLVPASTEVNTKIAIYAFKYLDLG
jgi:hypothetical protein